MDRGDWQATVHVVAKELDMIPLAIPLETFCKTEDPFTLLPHCLSLSVLPFDFSSPLLLSF